MQGTVAGYDEMTRSGHVLTDQGHRVDFPGESLANDVRHLRVGQRVFLETGPTGAVTSVSIWPRR
jgi:hypothetical protein